jgi:hypothetical protein
VITILCISCLLSEFLLSLTLLFRRLCYVLDYQAARLAELAIHLGSSDNVSVIIVRFFNRSNLQEA